MQCGIITKSKTITHHQECRGKAHLEQYLGADAAKRLTCPLAPK